MEPVDSRSTRRPLSFIEEIIEADNPARRCVARSERADCANDYATEPAREESILPIANL